MILILKRWPADLLLIPLHIVSISYSFKWWPDDLPDEYRSPTSSIEHFRILIMCKCWPAHLHTYSPAYFPHFLLIKCWPVKWIQVPVHVFYLSASSKCRPADFPICLLLLTCVAHNFPYSFELFCGVLISTCVWMWLSQIQDHGGFGGGLCSPSWTDVSLFFSN